ADNIFGITDIIEDGKTYQENALIKAEAYYNLLLNKGYLNSNRNLNFDKKNKINNNHSNIDNQENINIDYIVSEDTGLEVKCLNNEPGLYTARYSKINNINNFKDINKNNNYYENKNNDEKEAKEAAVNLKNSNANNANIDIDNINKLLNNMKYKKDCSHNREARFICWACVYSVRNKEYKFFHGELNGFITETLTRTAGFGYDPVFYAPEFSKTLAELGEEIKNKISHRASAFKKVIDFISGKS
ncbi:MAG: non-canonical purine NTP pyrophosphatase, partial [bacterium]